MKSDIDFKTLATRVADEGLFIEHSARMGQRGQVVLIIPGADFGQVLELLDLGTIYRLENMRMILACIGLPGRYWVMSRFNDGGYPGWFFGLAKDLKTTNGSYAGSFIKLVDSDVHHLIAAIQTGRSAWAQDVERTQK